MKMEQNSVSTPPKIPFWIVKSLSQPYHRSSALGDLDELYAHFCVERGVRKANRWYWRQALRSIPPLIHHFFFWSVTMFRSYLKITWRNILRHKSFSFINISGLAVGMACCILIMMYVAEELSYDNFHEKGPRIYRANTISSIGTNRRSFAVVPSVFSEEMAASMPEIEYATRLISYGLYRFRYKNQEHDVSNLAMVDPSFFKIFSYDFAAGDQESALDKPDSMVITEEIARRIFGQKDPLGEILTPVVQNTDVNPLQITGVLKNVPKNSHLRFDALLNIKGLQHIFRSDRTPDFLLDPYYCRLETFFLLKEDSDIPELEKKINRIAQNKWGEIYKERGTTREFFLLNIRDIHLHSPNEDEYVPAGDIKNVYLFSAIALLILLIACFNFINLSTARSANRATEIGIRKVIGSQKAQLIKQFLCESILMSIIGLLIGVLLVFLVLPSFSNLLNKEIEINTLLNFSVLIGILGIVILTGFVAGSFPAFILSAFDPIKVLKGKLRSASKNSLLRKTLVVFQFAVSIFMIAGVITVVKQLDFIKNKNLGFHKEQMAVITSPGHSSDVLRQKILQNPGVESVSFSLNVPGIFIAYQAFNPSLEDTRKETLRAFQMIADYDFLETYDLEVKWGRGFSKEYSTDVDEAIVINEKTAEILGWGEDAIGEKLYNVAEKNREKTVIGVVKDFHTASLKAEISPVVIELDPTAYRYVSVRLHPGNIPKTLASLENIFREVQPNQEFSYYFIDDAFRQMYPEEDKVGQIYMSFGLLAIFVACLGLFGLSSFAAAQRTKEIGIRKVLGASIREIVTMLSKEFTALILVANLIAWPLAYFIMQGWLRSFAYRIPVTWDIFLLSGIIAIAVALLTISQQSIKAAVSHPVDALRYE
jgi:putative ABC transport system permease protein